MTAMRCPYVSFDDKLGSSQEYNTTLYSPAELFKTMRPSRWTVLFAVLLVSVYGRLPDMGDDKEDDFFTTKKYDDLMDDGEDEDWNPEIPNLDDQVRWMELKQGLPDFGGKAKGMHDRLSLHGALLDPLAPEDMSDRRERIHFRHHRKRRDDDDDGDMPNMIDTMFGGFGKK